MFGDWYLESLCEVAEEIISAVEDTVNNRNQVKSGEKERRRTGPRLHESAGSRIGIESKRSTPPMPDFPHRTRLARAGRRGRFAPLKKNFLFFL
jgi:hypothetical protein